jgi:hypothetical protein
MKGGRYASGPSIPATTTTTTTTTTTATATATTFRGYRGTTVAARCGGGAGAVLTFFCATRQA